MSIQAVLEKGAFEALEDPLKPFYKESADGNYKLNISSDEAVKLTPDIVNEVERLRKHNQTVLGEKKAVQTQLADLQAEIDSLRDAGNKKPVDPDPDIAAKLKSFEDAKKDAETRLQDLQGQVANQMKRAEIARLRAEFDLNETADFVLDKFLEVADADGELSVRVVRDGKPFYLAGDAVTPETLIKGFKDAGQHLGIFKAPAGGGTGGRNDHGGRPSAKTMKRSAFATMSPAEQADFIKGGGLPVD